MTFDEWSKQTAPLLGEFTQKAMGLWEYAPRQDMGLSSDALWEPSKKEEEARLGRLFDAFSKAEQIQPSDSAQSLEEEMSVKLGLWFCSYFANVPRHDLWGDVAAIAFHSGGYPEGAFYLKLAGDAFRFERRRLDKNPPAPQGEFPNSYWRKDGILVMAYSPLLLVPTQDIASNNSARGDYNKWLKALALNYVRIQQRAYLYKGYPIRYTISRGSACEALYHSTEGDDENTRRSKSDALLKMYLPNGIQGNQDVLVTPFGITRRRGLTSCVLASEDGVISSLPNRFIAKGALCTWVEGRPLVSERRKLCALWEEYQGISGRMMESEDMKNGSLKTEDYECFSLKNYSADNFAEKWYDDEIAKRLKREADTLVDNENEQMSDSEAASTVGMQQEQT